MASGTVFNIQRFSTHDGPGIRTTVFLKGCPLDCWWCHNPEGIGSRALIVVNTERCLSCGECNAVCPLGCTGAAECLLCGVCAQCCPAEARTMYGRVMTAGEVIEIVRRDLPFYEASGGGVTFSGGEPLMQPEFLQDLLHSAKTLGIATAVDTSGYAPWSSLESLVPLVDIFLYDVKHMDSREHEQMTGVPNEMIIDNLRRLVSRHSDVRLRVPVIPGHNDSAVNMARTAALAGCLGLKELHLLPYHRTGTGKHDSLGLSYRMANIQPPSAGEMERLAISLRGTGLNIHIGG